MEESVSGIARKLVAEFIGTMFLVVAAIGSVILPYEVLGADIATTVFINAVAVGFVLFALIEMLSPISGSHFNPAVSLAFILTRDMEKKKGICYIIAQMAGGMMGLLATHLMFYDVNPSLILISGNAKGVGTYFGEFLGTFLLLAVIYGCVRGRSANTSLSVGLVVGGMLISTSSTMYANPAVTISRVFTYAICGIAPVSAAFFILAEIAGAVTAGVVLGYLYPRKVTEKCLPFECPAMKLRETGREERILLETEDK